MSPSDIWQATLGELELQLSKAHFMTWFKHTHILTMSDGHITISVPNTFTKTWLEKKYNMAILKSLQHVLNIPIREVSYEVKAPGAQTSSLPKENVIIGSPVLGRAPNSQATLITETVNKYGLRVNYTFENFIVGKGNELAHAAALAVTENPGVKYNPLFIYGGVGLGKTHLLQAIGHRLLTKKQGCKILYITCEQFTNDFINAMRSGQGKEFKDRYRNVDLLLIDDIQFITGKEMTQEELFHTFNTLHQYGKQVVYTSDRPPKGIVGIEERMRSRLEWGGIVDISNPDFETRMAILSQKCEEKQIFLLPEVLQYIASALQSNVRELEGALNKIVANHQLHNTPITLEGTKLLLNSFTANIDKKNLNSKFLIETVINYFDLTLEDIVGKSREQKLAFPRQIIMYLLRQELRVSFPSIGKEIGGRDHTTAMHACDKIKKEIENNEKTKKDIEIIKQRLYSV